MEHNEDYGTYPKERLRILVTDEGGKGCSWQIERYDGEIMLYSKGHTFNKSDAHRNAIKALQDWIRIEVERLTK